MGQYQLIMYNNINQIMNFSKQGFLQAFKFLNTGVNTKQANNYLLQLQASPESLGIALQLLNQSTDQIKLYGATLINKQILSISNTPLDHLLFFLFTKINQNQHHNIITNQLCGAISKLLVNHSQLMDQFVSSIRQSGNQQTKLKIIRQIPISICCHTKSILEYKSQATNQFKTFIPILIRSWEYTDLALEVIENYSQFCKIDILYSEELLNLLLSLPIQRTLKILNDFLCNQNRENPKIVPKLGKYILGFVNQEELVNNRSYVFLYIELCRYLILSPIGLEDFQFILSHLLKFIMKSKDLIIDSGQFWMQITTMALEEKITEEQKFVLCQAFQTLNSKILQLSVLKKLIPRNTSTADTIVLSDEQQQQDLELQLGEVIRNFDNVQTDVLTFRQTAEDLIRMAYKIIRLFPQKLNSYFTQMHKILTQGQLYLELVLFNLKSIIDNITSPQEQNYVSNIINIFLEYFQNLPKQILIPLTQLLYDCDYIFTTNTQLTQKCLAAFLAMLRQQQVSRLLAQTIQNIVETVCANQSNTKLLLQNFVSQIFEGITDISNDVVRDSILGAIITLVTNQPDPVDAYKNLLSQLMNKTQGLSVEKQFQIIHSIIFVHDLKINDDKLNKLLGYFVEVIASNIIGVYEMSSKDHKTKLICLLSKSAKKFGEQIPSCLISLNRYFLEDTFKTNININYSISLLAASLQFYNADREAYSQFLVQILPFIIDILSKQQKPEILIAQISLYQSLTSIRYELDYTFVLSQLKRILKLPYNYNVTRQVLKYFISLIRNSIKVEDIVIEVMKRYHKIADIFHQQLMSVFIESYRLQGDSVIKLALQQANVQYNPEQYKELVNGLNNHEIKSIKNTLLSMTT